MTRAASTAASGTPTTMRRRPTAGSRRRSARSVRLERVGLHARRIAVLDRPIAVLERDLGQLGTRAPPDRWPIGGSRCTVRSDSLGHAWPPMARPMARAVERAGELAGDAAARQHDDAVGDGEHLLQLGAHPHHGGAGGGGVEQAVGDGAGRAGVEPAGRVARRRRGRAAASSSRASTSFWALPPDRLRTGAPGPADADVPRLQARRGAPGGGLRRRGRHHGPRPSSTLSARLIGRTSAVAVAVRRDVGDAAGDPVGAASRAGRRSPSSVTVPGVGRLDAGEHGLQLGLPVAVDAGDAEHLAGAHGERRRRAGRPSDTPSTSRRTGGVRGATGAGSRRVAAPSCPARPSRRRASRRVWSATAASARTTAPSRSTVTRSQPVDDLAEAVGDDHDGPALVGEPPAHREQAVGLARR